MLTVEKIGGTSMSQFQDVLQNIIRGNRKGDQLYNRIFVVSAYNNVTNWLLEHKKTGEPGIYNKFLNGEDYSSALDSFCQRLLLINDGFADNGLDLKEARDFIRFRVDQAKTVLYSLGKVLASGYVNRTDIHLAAREILASIGEEPVGDLRDVTAAELMNEIRRKWNDKQKEELDTLTEQLAEQVEMSTLKASLRNFKTAIARL